MSNNLLLTPGRRWALSLGVPIALVAIAYSGLGLVSLVGKDSFKVGTTVPVTDKLTVAVGSGNIALGPVLGAPLAPHAEITGVVSYSLVRPHVHWSHSGGTTRFSAPNCAFWVTNCGADLSVGAPVNIAVNASSGSGNLRATGLKGPLNLSDGSGNIRVANASGHMVLSDSSGNVTGTALTSRHVSTSDGSGDVALSFRTAPSRVDVNASSGNIIITVPGGHSYDVVATASSGSSEVKVPTSSASHHVLRVTDGSGNIEVLPGPGQQ